MRTIDIGVPWVEIEERRARLEAARRFEYLDRVPVTPGVFSRYWLHRFGKTWAEYTSDPRTMLELQLQAHKWVLENIAGDVTGVDVSPDLFSFYGESYALGCDLGHDDLTPWIVSHPICTESDLERLAKIDMADNRYTAALCQWMARMKLFLDRYQLRYADGVVHALPAQLHIATESIGVFTLATDLRGPAIYEDVYERPAFVHQLLSIVADKVIARSKWLHSLGVHVNAGTYLVDDSSGALSPRHYREFVYAYVMRVVDAIGRPLTIHIDAPANHLLRIYRQMDIQELSGFGWGTSVELVRHYLGGRAVLTGNLEPTLFIHGTPEDIYSAAMRALRALAPSGGFILQEGANLPPGAPIENINAMVRAAEDYAREGHH
jgi:uroporphyrinogen decarboxylase